MGDYKVDDKEAVERLIESARDLVKELKSSNAAIPISAARELSSLESALIDIGVDYCEINGRGY